MEHLNQTLAALEEDGLSEDASLVLIAEMENSISKLIGSKRRPLHSESDAIIEALLIRALDSTSSLVRNSPSDLCSFVASQATIMTLDAFITVAPSGPAAADDQILSWCQATFDSIFDDYTLNWKKRHVILATPNKTAPKSNFAS